MCVLFLLILEHQRNFLDNPVLCIRLCEIVSSCLLSWTLTEDPRRLRIQMKPAVHIIHPKLKLRAQWWFSGSVVSNPLWPHGLQPARLLCPWDFLGKNTGVSYRFLLQGIFLTQGLNPRLLHWQADSLPLSHQGSPKISNWDLANCSIQNCRGSICITDTKYEATQLLACCLSSLYYTVTLCQRTAIPPWAKTLLPFPVKPCTISR